MTQKTTPANASQSAATDMTEFMTDLDGGQFERALSVAISTAAAAVVDNAKKGKVVVTLDLLPIPGTHQLHIQHTLAYNRPTADGQASEKQVRTTAMHVGKFGKLTLAPENQMSFMDREGRVAAPTTPPNERA